VSRTATVRKSETRRSVGAVTVVFDKPLRELDPDDAEAWRLWLVEHQLDALTIACPSRLVCQQPTGDKPASVTVELLTRDPRGALRSKKTINFSGSLLPFPPGYRITTTNAPTRARGRVTPRGLPRTSLRRLAARR
jgi:hypothetical protein